MSVGDPEAFEVFCGACGTELYIRDYDSMCNWCRKELCVVCLALAEKTPMCEVTAKAPALCYSLDGVHQHEECILALCSKCTHTSVDWSSTHTRSLFDAFIAQQFGVRTMADVRALFVERRPWCGTPGKQFAIDSQGFVVVIPQIRNDTILNSINSGGGASIATSASASTAMTADFNSLSLDASQQQQPSVSQTKELDEIHAEVMQEHSDSEMVFHSQKHESNQ
jgi:hypothetical protein